MDNLVVLPQGYHKMSTLDGFAVTPVGDNSVDYVSAAHTHICYIHVHEHTYWLVRFSFVPSFPFPSSSSSMLQGSPSSSAKLCHNAYSLLDRSVDSNVVEVKMLSKYKW